jgi:hypothetical protein
MPIVAARAPFPLSSSAVAELAGQLLTRRTQFAAC